MALRKNVRVFEIRSFMNGLMSDLDAPNSSEPLQRRLEGYELRRKRLRAAGYPATYDLLAERAGINKTTVHRTLTGGRKRIKSSDEAAIRSALETMERECRAQFGDDALDLAGDETHVGNSAPGQRFPIYGARARAGAVMLSQDHVVGWLDVSEALFAAPGREIFLFEVNSDDMAPRYFQGERVLIRRNQPPQPGQDALIEFADGHAELKTYRHTRQGRVWYESYRDADASGSAEATQVHALHAVLRF